MLCTHNLDRIVKYNIKVVSNWHWSCLFQWYMYMYRFLLLKQLFSILHACTCKLLLMSVFVRSALISGAIVVRVIDVTII